MRKLAIFIIALFSASVFAQDLPRIAVYVTGDVPDNEKKALGTQMLVSLVNSGRYKGIERSNAFLTEIEKEHVKQQSGNIDESRISELGKQFGVKFVCIVAITPVFGEFQISARVVDVEMAQAVFIGVSASPMKSMVDLTQVSDQIVKSMFEGQIRQALEPEPKPAKQARRAALGAEQEKIGADNGIYLPDKKVDRYFTYRYLPIASPVVWGMGFNIETGWVWGDGLFAGIDFGGAFGFSNMSTNTADVRINMGVGLNFGKPFELSPELKLVFGGSAGFWGTASTTTALDYDRSTYNYLFFGPFVRLRYYMFEISYRALFGSSEEYHYDYHYDVMSDRKEKIGFSSQLGVGVHFETRERFTGRRDYDKYIALRYLPIASPVYLSPYAYNIEIGRVWGEGAFAGLDLSFAQTDDYLAAIGIGFSMGKTYDLDYDLKIAVGGSTGVWAALPLYDPSDISIYHLGPFVRLRWHALELSYRMLFGSIYYYYDLPVFLGFSITNQLGVGLYFEGSKRHR